MGSLGIEGDDVILLHLLHDFGRERGLGILERRIADLRGRYHVRPMHEEDLEAALKVVLRAAALKRLACLSLLRGGLRDGKTHTGQALLGILHMRRGGVQQHHLSVHLRGLTVIVGQKTAFAPSGKHVVPATVLDVQVGTLRTPFACAS